MCTIMIHTTRYSYRDETEEWMDGDRVETGIPATTFVEYDEDEREEWQEFGDGTMIGWAANYIRNRTSVSEASSFPIGEELGEYAWLGGEVDDSYGAAVNVEETSVYVKDVTPEERALIFKAVNR